MIIREMTAEECREMLAPVRLGRLACARDGQPYVVPAYCAFHEPTPGEAYLYAFATPGQKVQWMRENPLVCFEWDEVASDEAWVSVLAFGRYEELPDTPEWHEERLHAHQLLQRYAFWWEPGAIAHLHRDPAETLTPVFYRIRVDRMTGRRALPGPP